MMLELDESVPEAQTVDCQLSASDGVIVQVTGNLQCKVRVPVLGVMYASLRNYCTATAGLQLLQRRMIKLIVHSQHYACTVHRPCAPRLTPTAVQCWPLTGRV